MTNTTEPLIAFISWYVFTFVTHHHVYLAGLNSHIVNNIQKAVTDLALDCMCYSSCITSIQHFHSFGDLKSDLKPYFFDHTWAAKELVLEGHSYRKKRKKIFFFLSQTVDL